MDQPQNYKLLVKWQKRQGVASTFCRNIDQVLSDVENFLTGEYPGEDDTDSVVKIVIRRTTMEEDLELIGRDIVDDNELI